MLRALYTSLYYIYVYNIVNRLHSYIEISLYLFDYIN